MEPKVFGQMSDGRIWSVITPKWLADPDEEVEWLVQHYPNTNYFYAEVVPVENNEPSSGDFIFYYQERNETVHIFRDDVFDPVDSVEMFPNHILFYANLAPLEDPTDGLKLREGDQPLPIHNDNVGIQTLVVEDILERLEVGVKRYGTPLQAHNGRDALRDAYEEALDLVIYLRQVIEERDGADT